MKEILEQISVEVSVPVPAASPNAQLYGLVDSELQLRLDPEKLATFLAKQQEAINVLKEAAINSHLENIKNTLAVTENPDQSITYKGDTYHRKITPQEVHKAWKEAKTITEAMGLDKP